MRKHGADLTSVQVEVQKKLKSTRFATKAPSHARLMSISTVITGQMRPARDRSLEFPLEPGKRTAEGPNQGMTNGQCIPDYLRRIHNT